MSVTGQNPSAMGEDMIHDDDKDDDSYWNLYGTSRSPSPGLAAGSSISTSFAPQPAPLSTPLGLSFPFQPSAYPSRGLGYGSSSMDLDMANQSLQPDQQTERSPERYRETKRTCLDGGIDATFQYPNHPSLSRNQYPSAHLPRDPPIHTIQQPQQQPFQEHSLPSHEVEEQEDEAGYWDRYDTTGQPKLEAQTTGPDEHASMSISCSVGASLTHPTSNNTLTSTLTFRSPQNLFNSETTPIGPQTLSTVALIRHELAQIFQLSKLTLSLTRREVAEIVNDALDQTYPDPI